LSELGQGEPPKATTDDDDDDDDDDRNNQSSSSSSFGIHVLGKADGTVRML